VVCVGDVIRKRILMFKQNQIVIFNDPPKEYENLYPFKKCQPLLFLGEVVQMPGHCIVVDKSGKVYWGYHISNFREPLDNEF